MPKNLGYPGIKGKSEEPLRIKAKNKIDYPKATIDKANGSKIGKVDFGKKISMEKVEVI